MKNHWNHKNPQRIQFGNDVSGIKIHLLKMDIKICSSVQYASSTFETIFTEKHTHDFMEMLPESVTCYPVHRNVCNSALFIRQDHLMSSQVPLYPQYSVVRCCFHPVYIVLCYVVNINFNQT